MRVADVLQRYTERMSQRPPVLERYQAQRETFERKLVTGSTQASPRVPGEGSEQGMTTPSRTTLAPVIARYNQVQKPCLFLHSFLFLQPFLMSPWCLRPFSPSKICASA